MTVTPVTKEPSTRRSSLVSIHAAGDAPGCAKGGTVVVSDITLLLLSFEWMTDDSELRFGKEMI
jgi:hypothetical protein